MENKVLVFDDIIDLEYQEKIKNVLIGEETFNDYYFPWYFTQDVTNQKDKNSQKRSALTHQYVISEDDTNTVGTIDSVFHDLFIPLLNKACNKVDKQNISIIKGRSFLQLPINYKGKKEDTPHIDIIDSHFVMLYYVCDSDGDTIIYNEQKKSDNYTVQKRITPKQGRVVIFDGMYWHTAEQPKKDVRCILNFNISTNGT